MAEVTPGTMPLTAQTSGGRPIRKDEIELHDRGIYIECWLPGTAIAPQAAPVRPRRARRFVGLGALPRVLRVARLGGPRPQPAQPLLVADGRPDDAHVRHATPRTSSRRCDRLGPTRPSSSATGMGGLLALKAAERDAAGRRSCSSARSCRASCASRPGRTSCARSRDVYGRGAASAGRPCPSASSATTATCRSPTSCGSSTSSARSRTSPARPGARCCSASRSTARRSAGLPILVIGGGLDRSSPSRTRSAWPSGSARTTSRSAPTRTSASSSASTATSRSPTRSALPRGATASERGRGSAIGRARWYHAGRSGVLAPSRQRRIRLEAQDTALSRRRPPVRIRYAVPDEHPDAPGPRPGGVLLCPVVARASTQPG